MLYSILKNLWILVSTFSFLLVVIPTAKASPSLAEPAIDYWREFPDTKGLCRAPGFKQNKTDCTQFYRCVDFNMRDGKEIYTVFRFKCGPMTVFDERWSVCTWPDLANPPCKNKEQLTTIFPEVVIPTLTENSTETYTDNPLPYWFNRRSA